MHRSISTINADVAQTEFGARGQGIVWAVMASGVDSSHPHFDAYQNLTLPSGLSHWDFSDLKAIRAALRKGADREMGRRLPLATDLEGYGTSVAAVIAGESKNDQGETLRGMAPECKLLSVNVLSKRPFDAEFNVIAALQAIQAMNAGAADNVRVHGVLLPLEITWDVRNYACGYSPVCIEVDRLVNSGVVVVVPAGNAGFDQDSGRSVESTIRDPGNAPNAITVGSTHRTLPREYGPSFFSARGPTADGRLKPDLLAPGERIDTCLAAKCALGEGRATDRLDGTGYAAAHVAGAVAAILSVQRDLIGRPLDVKNLLLQTAVDLGREKVYQGAGLLDVVAALRRAREVKGQSSEPKGRGPLKVFCSYSHHDSALWLEFKTHLSPMERIKLIEVWSDQAIPAGTEWEPQIYDNLAAANIVLLLVSSYFVASEYCYSNELAQALKRHRDKSARVVPILVRPVDIAGTPIAELQMLPGGHAVTKFKDPHDAWAEVAKKLREVVMELRDA